MSLDRKHIKMQKNDLDKYCYDLYFSGHKLEFIGKRLGVTKNTARQRICRHRRYRKKYEFTNQVNQLINFDILPRISKEKALYLIEVLKAFK